jgi:hypothetical protein
LTNVNKKNLKESHRKKIAASDEHIAIKESKVKPSLTQLWREAHTQSHQRQRLMVEVRLIRLSVLATQFTLGN